MSDYEFHIDRFSLMTSLLNVVNETSSESSVNILARYFLEHLYELGKLNIYDVAEDCYISRSGVQRFCKAIGFDTFSNLKINSPVEIGVHQGAIIGYANRENFRSYARDAMGEMMLEIEELSDRQDISDLARRIHDCRRVVLLSAEYSSMAPRNLQQELMAIGKLVFIVTDSHTDFTLLRSLGEDELLIVCSATGNYAYVAQELVGELTLPVKALITLSRDPIFRGSYDKVFYLSENADNCQRSVYTKYGMSFFFDLLYNTYLQMFYRA